MKPYAKLRAQMVIQDIKYKDIAKMLSVDATTLSMKLTGKRIITLWEAYTICDVLEIPKNEIVDYFPPELAFPNIGLRNSTYQTL